MNLLKLLDYITNEITLSIQHWTTVSFIKTGLYPYLRGQIPANWDLIRFITEIFKVDIGGNNLHYTESEVFITKRLDW
jgi:hypothetical protein